MGLIHKPSKLGREGGWDKVCNCLQCGYHAPLAGWTEWPDYFECRQCFWQLSKQGTWFYNKMFGGDIRRLKKLLS